MADYGYGATSPPTQIPYTHSAGSKEMIVDPVLISRAASGSVRGRLLQSSRKRAFQVEHEYLTTAEKDNVISFINTKRGQTFTFAWTFNDGNTYTVIFSDREGITWTPVGDHWHCMMTFLEV